METKSDLDAGITESKESFLARVSHLAKKHSWEHNSRTRIPSVTKLVLSNACERQIDFELRNPTTEAKKFDAIYKEKSDYATIKILDHLKTKLDQLGVQASIATEVKDSVGVYDVTIVQGNPCEIWQGSRKVVRLEIKASLGLPLEQLERYLWNPTPLVLVRVIPGQVTLLKPSELTDFVRFSLEANQAKAERLLQGKFYTVPGNYCTFCRDIVCSFNPKREHNVDTMVRMKDSEFGMDLRSFLTNLPYVAERTATLVVQELSTKNRPKEADLGVN